jgi:hypothetical protein
MQRLKIVSAPAGAFNPQDLLTVEQLAARLRPDLAEAKGVQWVREKIRRRCPYPMPVYNLGKHLLFDWTAVSEWIRSAPRPVHALHIRRKTVKKAA